MAKVLQFQDWYHPGIKYKNFMYNLKRTEDPFQKELGKPGLFFMSLGGLFLLSEEWANTHAMPLWQFWVKEYIGGLAKRINKEYDRPRVLEVGAGDGWLSYLLEKEGVNIVGTTDDKSWAFHPRMDYIKPVEKLPFGQAISKYRPDVILVSWMPYTHDWTKVFRRYKSTKGYIIIGEGEGGCCGSGGCFNPPAGWVVERSTDFDKYNLCRTDYSMDLLNPKLNIGWQHHSCTTSVRRVK